MTRVKVSVIALLLATAMPASAQSAQSAPPRLQFVEDYKHVFRLNVGVGFFNSGWYNCYYGYGACVSGSYTSYVPLVVGPQVDFNIGGMSNLSLAFNVLIGTISYTASDNTNQVVSASNDVSMWEAAIDYVAKFGSANGDTIGRLRAGGGLYIGPAAGLGGVFRIGGGASFLHTKSVGMGLDLVLEAGKYQGYWMGGLELMASPELHF